MKILEVGDRVWTMKGNGTIIAKHEPTIMPSETYTVHEPTIMPSKTYTVELDNGKGIYRFYRWGLEHIAHPTEKGHTNET